MKKPFKLSAQSLHDFTEAGVPLALMLSVSLEISVDELYDRIRRGEIYVVSKKKSKLKSFLQWIKKRLFIKQLPMVP